MTILYEDAAPNPGGHRDVAPTTVAGAGGKVRLVDVREPAEYTGELGHAPGSELVPLATLESASETWDREQEIVMICRSGARSGRAAAQLTAMGFRHVMNMTGGMIRWNEEKLAVER